jgi:hypothetical protein
MWTRGAVSLLANLALEEDVCLYLESSSKIIIHESHLAIGKTFRCLRRLGNGLLKVHFCYYYSLGNAKR